MTAAPAHLAALRTRLQAIGQEHLLRFYGELSPARQRALLEQIAALDLNRVPQWVRQYVLSRPPVPSLDRLEPAPYYPADPASPARPWDPARYRKIGEELVRGGKVAAFTVAGGQGTRLGFDGPKGAFPAGAVTAKPLFRIFAEGLIASSRRFGASIPWYIMTSPQNHETTLAFFRGQEYFGLNARDVMFCSQGEMPAFDKASGRILLADRDRIATSPDGHGGAVQALHRAGALADMRRRGIEHLSYFQVDNPLVRVIDPVFLGLHVAAPDSSAEMSSKMVAKAAPDERVGVFACRDGRTLVIEYSDLPAELAHQQRPDGSLRFNAGSIAVHVISVAFLERLATDPAAELPFHRAEKKVPYVDLETGQAVEPAEPNAVKLERFIFDALPLCRQSLVLETDRVEEFAPIKNAEGTDSPETCRRLQTLRAARWLERVGIPVPRRADGEPDCVLEISPLTALEPDDLRQVSLLTPIEPGARLAL